MPPISDSSKFRPMSWCLHGFSRLPLVMLQQFAKMLAALFWLFPEQGMLKTIRRNLLLCFPDWTPEQRQQYSRTALRNQLMSFAEFFWCWGNAPEKTQAHMGNVYGAALLEQALANPKGCMAIVPHYGSWELMNAWLNQFTQPVVMYKPSPQPDLNQFVLHARHRLQQTMVPTDDQGVRLIFRALKTGGFTIILPDHTPKASGGIPANFFGYPTLTTTLAAKLIQKTQCQVIMLSCTRQTADSTRFDYYIEPIADAVYSPDLQMAVETINQAIEQRIRQHPEHYHWAYKRFRSVAGLEDIYLVDDHTAEQHMQHFHGSRS